MRAFIIGDAVWSGHSCPLAFSMLPASGQGARSTHATLSAHNETLVTLPVSA